MGFSRIGKLSKTVEATVFKMTLIPELSIPRVKIFSKAMGDVL
jgi:hypothetical protein